MNSGGMVEGKTLVLVLGNELVADDAVGPAVAECLRTSLPPGVVLKVLGVGGMALLEELLGFSQAIIVDAVKTGKEAPGFVHHVTADDLTPVVAPSAHWAGLPEVKALAEALGLPFPGVTILAVEAEDLVTVGQPLSPPVAAAVPLVVREVLGLIGALQG